MDSFRRFQDDDYKNWIKTTMGLNCLKTRLGGFLEHETETYHDHLRNKVNANKGDLCTTQCNLKKWMPRPKQVPQVCEVCEPWRDEIWANHSFKGGQVYWNNSKPYLWPTKKWEVAKVTNVRNQVMHSADFRVEKRELESYLGRIKDLGQALKTHYPKFSELTEEIEQLQNTDFSFIMSCVGKKIVLAADKIPESMLKLQNFLSLEQQILKEKLECLSQRYEEDRETALTLEELQCVRVFLEGNNDLQKSLAPQWERLTEVQERVDTLTFRVDTLEMNTRTHDPEFSTDILKYKNHLYEEARRQGWPEPVFSEIKEALGYRGRVQVRGQTFEGVQVCPKSKTAHQEVAKLALSQLAKDCASLSELANDTEEGEASSSQTDQPQSLSCTGPVFFGSVTVVLKTDITSGEGHSGMTEAVQSAYKKLALLLDLPESASSYKDVVLEHCHTRDVPPPEEAVQSDAEEKTYQCTLRFTGPITFYVPEGSSKKKQACQQAAKVALQRLSGVLGSKEVMGGNYVSTLKELLEAQTPQLDKPAYDVTDRGRGAGEVTERGEWRNVEG
uniref:DRBM domain-containing protein n=1 Tax=Oncorhynchus tshawytscha TaxID=74940 RepID=A0AAZ3RJA2_ONCTS